MSKSEQNWIYLEEKMNTIEIIQQKLEKLQIEKDKDSIVLENLQNEIKSLKRENELFHHNKDKNIQKKCYKRIK